MNDDVWPTGWRDSEDIVDPAAARVLEDRDERDMLDMPERVNVTPPDFDRGAGVLAPGSLAGCF